MSWLNTLTVDSFRKYNPDWEITIYVPVQDYRKLGKNTFVPDYTGPDYWPEFAVRNNDIIKWVDITEYGVPLSAHSCQGSDNFRRTILYNEGGVYSDFDTIWLRPVEEIKNVSCIGNPEDFDCTVSFYEMTKGFHNVSNLIAEPGSLFLKSLIDISKSIPDTEIRNNHQALGSMMLNRFYPTLESVQESFPRVLAIPYETFYPYSTYHMERLFIEDDLSYITGNTLCIHWFNGNAYAKDYINKEDYARVCSMTTILRREGYI